MSSTLFSTELATDKVLRRVVLGSGALLTITGILVIATLPGPPHWLWPAATLWGLAGLREIRIIASGYDAYQRIRISSTGAMELRRSTDDWMPVELLAGSVVLLNLAWLRFRLADGSRCCELLRGNAREDEAWRRFQLIWRHLGGAR
ncbi:MAG: hypothetical protein OEM63_15840 [Gammaproteobacteria bacterium]|nr:hypothetical protein [Gammaproteobacteria bacterium]